jgi:hypothetical protein
MAVSHGCVRLSPANAAVLYGLVEQTGLPDTTVIVHGSIPTRYAPVEARRQAPADGFGSDPLTAFLKKFVR